MKNVTLAELKEKFDESLHDGIDTLAERASALILFENCNMSGPRLGERTVMGVGKNFTYKSVDEVEDGYLGDLPSRRQYPTAYVET